MLFRDNNKNSLCQKAALVVYVVHKGLNNLFQKTSTVPQCLVGSEVSLLMLAVLYFDLFNGF